ncbi:thioredoxin domain-containing protein [endosymbiont of Ridgeia piscesae]|jgi:uncharacterized protein YyaL (SSP411 family)|uniref:Thioredoxin n=1 Tax=endosymbiont of Ridgeia piscesae TaxID=54398 RepID=A0A0T5YWV9_9GAMM|nr:thioredoxin domain-containing protein [endosymbiont of Ridgeia piscesae]KRT55053.1 hypothetical protein Ga0074115_11325 [endosymbiont of Ridgeia piscesae]KRT57082.1 hypothetical protein Ga0076813_108412 [endosymbiont of Ridgeia piscesae]
MHTRLLAALLLTLSWQAFGAEGRPPHYQVTRPMQIQQQLEAAYLAKGVGYHPRTEHLEADGKPRYLNRLILEDSPYLLQHAHNPVDWYPWGEAAFAKAKRENKPIFLSIGYSTCHWCHVMERESFENESIARFLNKHFVAIKVDRESHPDIDETYMTAVMLMTGSGGWPMSSLLTPDGKPFFGGTYFPPQQFASVLQQIQAIWEERPEDARQQAERVAKAVEAANSQRGKAKALDSQAADKAVAQMLRSFDELQGGFSQAPKFPHEPWLFLLLDQLQRQPHPEALQALEVTLDAMARGGIYDQAGGGFHRYSTDNEWLVPHFEKMLYNQAQLARIYLLAWRLTGKEQYRRVVTQTLDYVLREMTAPSGGFYSATDADSAGEEGLFFTWIPAEIRDALEPRDAGLAIELYAISERGNFEGRNILHLPQSLEEYAETKSMNLEALHQRIDHINQVLRQIREQREHPLRDDKIVTAWNGMMITAFAQAADLLDSDSYRQAAERAAEFLWQHNRKGAGQLWRVHLDGKSSISANQEDYAYLGEGLSYLYDLTGDPKWLSRSRELADAMLARFQEKDGGFYMSEAGENHFNAMGRPRDGGSDNAIASGSSVALHLLQRLWLRSGHLDYKTAAESLIAYFATNIERQPNGYTYMLSAVDNLNQGERTHRGYAALGGIRLEAGLKPMSDNKQLLELAIQIPEGWHINAHQPLGESLIPTELRLANNQREWRMTPVTYPSPVQQKLAFQRDPLLVYEGNIQLQATLEHKRTPGNGGATLLDLELQLQACSDEVCLPPETIQLQPIMR